MSDWRVDWPYRSSGAYRIVFYVDPVELKVGWITD
jgi:hypothetical protein